MATETRPFDPLAYINTPKRQMEYLRAALEDGDPSTIAVVIGDLAKAHGVTEFAAQTGLSRETIYKTFRAGGNPTLETIAKALNVLGLRLTLEPLPKPKRTARSA